MVLNLDKGLDHTWKNQLRTNKRSQVRKAGKNNLLSIAGKLELLDDFYEVWTQRINQLGTPVFSKRFFREILSTFGDDAWIQVVKKDEVITGAMFLLKHGQQAFDPWAATIPEYNKLGANSFLYWSAIEEAARRGCKQFDMGRSEMGSGTFEFKAEWGAGPKHLSYLYQPLVAQDKSAGEKYKSLIRIWQKQPNKLANIMGPYITRFLTDL